MLSGYKEKGGHKTECHDVICPSVIDLPMRVRIRQNSSDGWGIEKMQVQRYPGSSEFITYSLNGSTQFWVYGNADGGADAFPVCDHAKWCNLDAQGNCFHLIIMSPNILILLQQYKGYLRYYYNYYCRNNFLGNNRCRYNNR